MRKIIILLITGIGGLINAVAMFYRADYAIWHGLIALLCLAIFFVSLLGRRLSPEEICEKEGCLPGDMMETSGRGRYGTCKRCGASVHEHEWS